MTAFAPDVVIFNSQLSDASDRMFGRGHDANDRTRNIPRLLSKANMPEAISQYRSEAVEGPIAPMQHLTTFKSNSTLRQPCHASG